MLTLKTKFFQGLATISLLSLVLTAFVMPASAKRGYSNTVPSGTIINVESDEEISSKDAEVGDTFSTTVLEDVYIRNNSVIPAGSRIVGRITDVQRASGKGKPGAISVKFTRLVLDNGFSRNINGSLTSISNSENSTDYDDESQVKGRSATKRNIAFIGGGAGIGALIGALTGGGKGAAIGAAIGAGLGTGGAFFTKGQEAKVKRGTDFGVILNQSVNVPDYD